MEKGHRLLKQTKKCNTEPLPGPTVKQRTRTVSFATPNLKSKPQKHHVSKSHTTIPIIVTEGNNSGSSCSSSVPSPIKSKLKKKTAIDNNGNKNNTNTDSQSDSSRAASKSPTKRLFNSRNRFKKAAKASLDRGSSSEDDEKNPLLNTKDPTMLRVMELVMSAEVQSNASKPKKILTQKKGRPPPTIWTPAAVKIMEYNRPISLSKLVKTGRKIVITMVHSKTPVLNKNNIADHNLNRLKHFRVPSKHQLSHQLKNITEILNNCINKNEVSNRHSKGRIFVSHELPLDFPILHLSKSHLFDANQLMTSRRYRSDLAGFDLYQGTYEELVRWTPNLKVNTSQTDNPKNDLQHNIIIIGLKTPSYKPIKELEHSWMERTGTLHLCRRIPKEINIDRISFLRIRRTEVHENYLEESNQKDNISAGFTYLVLARLAPMKQSLLLTLLEFVYNMKLEQMKGYIAVYKQRYAPTPVNRPSSQLSNNNNNNNANLSPRLLSKQNTL